MNKETAKNIREALTADCSACFGLCCTALHIIASSDFPINKPSGIPCVNLESDNSCQLHSQLREKGFKGCTVYDCLGAGQAVSQVIFNGRSRRDYPETREKMFRVLPIMEQIHEMIAYASEALSHDIPNALSGKLTEKLHELQTAAKLDADELLTLDLEMWRFSLRELLTAACDFIRENYIAKLNGDKRKQDFRHVRANWMGKKLKHKDLRAYDLRGAYLIAADMRNTDLRAVNFIGADLRDANLSGADLSAGMFLTQMQINSAKGDIETKLPAHIQRPSQWI